MTKRGPDRRSGPLRYVPVDVVAFSDRNIVLTGFMGTGKSSVGRELSRRLDFAWVDTDRIIEERHGPIGEIFERLGEPMFRSIERNIAAEVASGARQVISTGGRMLVDDDNVRLLSASGRIFCLDVDETELVDRLLSSRTTRPLLEAADPPARIRSLIRERRPAYRRFAQISTTGLSPSLAAGRIADLLALDPTTDDGLAGVALLGAVERPDATVIADGLGHPHLPALGPVAGLADAPTEGPLVLVGDVATLSWAAASADAVAVPTTPEAMRLRPTCRTIIDVATLHSLDPARLDAVGLSADGDAIDLLEFLDR